MAGPSKKLRLGNLDVTVSSTGEAPQPWGRGDPVFRYRVRVRGAPGQTYSSDAYGSIADYEKGEHRPDEMGAMVVDELLSANADPNEFLDMVIGESRGREALTAGRSAERVIRAAKKFRYEDLVRAVEQAREMNLL